MMVLTDLPEDILYLVIHYLPLSDFLAFCASSKVFQGNSSLRFSASYWSQLTRSTFRLPNHPVVAHDGQRWMALYRRMLTQTKVYAWGNNDGGCLGGKLLIGGLMVARPRAETIGGRLFGRRSGPDPRQMQWPGQMRIGSRGIIISDLQCGGWSTTALNSQGVLFTVGVIDGMTVRPVIASPVTHVLHYPPGFTQPGERYDPFTAIKQFSAGRSHVLGLSDSGRIWSWDSTKRPGLHIKFLSIDLVEGQTSRLSNAEGRVTKVLAGWNRSSAYIIGKGIVIWYESNNAEINGQSDQSELDAMLVLQSWIVPNSGYRISSRPHKNSSSSDIPPGDSVDSIGEASSWALLTQFVVFSTTTGKLFISKFSDYDTSVEASICLNSDRNFSQLSDTGEFILDVQGAHQRFAVFKRDGTVLISTEEHLHVIWNAHHSRQQPEPERAFSKIPSLQNAGVISVAFGDHHYHALHSDGTISSFGRELGQCGSLGLGQEDLYFMRGIVTRDELQIDGSAELLSECYGTGRKVMFEQEKREWLTRMHLSLLSDYPQEQSAAILGSPEIKAEISEWFEERLRNWNQNDFHPNSHANDASATAGYENSRVDDIDDGLPAYFALSVAAAGWHSGALVLVNEAKAQRAADRFTGSESSSAWKEWGDTFPKIRLRNGEILGVVEGEDEGAHDVVDVPNWLKEGGFKEVEQVAL